MLRLNDGTKIWCLASVMALALAIHGTAMRAHADGGEDTQTPGSYSFKNVPPPPSNGPGQLFIYSNECGDFVIGPNKANGTAKYFWPGDGKMHTDKLTFLFRHIVTDSRQDTPADVPVWVYLATDGTGNKWYLMFGEAPLTGVGGPKKLYPLYYTFDNPANNNAKVQRWLTQSGTSRR